MTTRLYPRLNEKSYEEMLKTLKITTLEERRWRETIGVFNELTFSAALKALKLLNKSKFSLV